MKDGGNCEWTFANKDGKTYFIKRYQTLSIQPPLCLRKIEKENKNLWRFQRTIRTVISGNSRCQQGNSIAPIDFFVYDGRFYIVTEKVDAAISFEELSKKSEEQKWSLWKCLPMKWGHWVRKIVHSDLKPGNLLIKKTIDGFYTIKIIDFEKASFKMQYPIRML